MALLKRSRALTTVFVPLFLSVSLGACRSVAVVSEPVGPVRSEPITQPGGDRPSDRFGRLFCTVLAHNPEGQSWDYCASYFEPAGPASDPGTLPQALPASHRVLVIPGIFGQCVEGIARPFDDAIAHVRQEHGLDVEYESVTAIGSTSYNARQIRDYVQRTAQADPRPIVAIGYSKGASDLLEAMRFDEVAAQVEAIVTVAGSVLGSRLTTGLPRGLIDWLEGRRLGSCSIGDGGGLDSLRRADAVRALATLQLPPAFKSYSVAAVSGPSSTSRVLQDSWDRLRAYSLEQDSQVIHEDAIVPGAAYLGFARADHWAVALPFEHAGGDPDARPPVPPRVPPAALGIIERFIDQNHYPRVTLFEALLRFVLDDLQASRGSSTPQLR